MENNQLMLEQCICSHLLFSISITTVQISVKQLMWQFYGNKEQTTNNNSLAEKISSTDSVFLFIFKDYS